MRGPEATHERDDRDEREPSPYLRRARRVEVRRGAARWRKVALFGSLIALASGGVLATTVYAINTYLSGSPRFALWEGLTISGADHVSRDQVARFFALDVGHSVFDTPLEQRRRQLSGLPWVQAAYVARAWPNRVRVVVSERRPVAFARTRPGPLWLIDRQGALLPMPRRGKFPLPVLTGVTESQTPAERARRVAVMLGVLQDLDREKPPRSGEVSEIDLSDPADAAVTVSVTGSAVLVHLGDAHFLARYKLFLENVEAWREQYGAVRSVDMRFDKQVVVKR